MIADQPALNIDVVRKRTAAARLVKGRKRACADTSGTRGRSGSSGLDRRGARRGVWPGRAPALHPSVVVTMRRPTEVDPVAAAGPNSLGARSPRDLPRVRIPWNAAPLRRRQRWPGGGVGERRPPGIGGRRTRTLIGHRASGMNAPSRSSRVTRARVVVPSTPSMDARCLAPVWRQRVRSRHGRSPGLRDHAAFVIGFATATVPAGAASAR